MKQIRCGTGRLATYMNGGLSITQSFKIIWRNKWEASLGKEAWMNMAHIGSKKQLAELKDVVLGLYNMLQHWVLNFIVNNYFFCNNMREPMDHIIWLQKQGVQRSSLQQQIISKSVTLLGKFCVLCLLPTGWRRIISTLKPVLALPYGQAVTATWPIRQHSTVADMAMYTLAARQLSVQAKWACICPHT